jgi:hypothetical protein
MRLGRFPPVEKEGTEIRRVFPMENTYEAPTMIEMGAFAEETQNCGKQNADEIVWFFDHWNC